MPFVLHSQPTGVFEAKGSIGDMATESHRRYAEIMKDVEGMIDDHSASLLRSCSNCPSNPTPVNHQETGLQMQSKLKLLVPSIGNFFTRLPLADAFRYQDSLRFISSRRFVPPSFNDIRLILNTAQVMGLASAGPLDLATFDGDVTLYPDGHSLEAYNPVISRIIDLMAHDTKIGIVTAAGYTEAVKYHERLHGILHAIRDSTVLTDAQKENLVVMGGESNFLFRYDLESPHLLTWVSRKSWILDEMLTWSESLIQSLLDKAEDALKECITNLSLPAQIIRKERAVGIIPVVPGFKFPRELLEETVLVVAKVLEMSEVGRKLPFCAFNGGNDVFVDIGDKSWGVLVCQKYFSDRDALLGSTRKIEGKRTMHVGDQFLSANGANDFKARQVGTTAWVANPAETVDLLDEVAAFMRQAEKKRM